MHLVALDLSLTFVYDFVHFSRDIATAPFPSVDTQSSLARTAERRDNFLAKARTKRLVLPSIVRSY